MSVKAVPDGYHTLTPHLVVKGASEAIEFYKKAFGAEELLRIPGPDGKTLMHAELKIGDSRLFLVDEWLFSGDAMPGAPKYRWNPSHHSHVYRGRGRRLQQSGGRRRAGAHAVGRYVLGRSIRCPCGSIWACLGPGHAQGGSEAGGDRRTRSVQVTATSMRSRSVIRLSPVVTAVCRRWMFAT